MGRIDQFRGVNAGGLIMAPSDATVYALLFEKVYLPRNLEIIIELAKKGYALRIPSETTHTDIQPACADGSDPFDGLTADQRARAQSLLLAGQIFGFTHRDLFGPVFETDAFPGGVPSHTITVEALSNGLNRFSFALQGITMTTQEEDTFASRVEMGYVPVVSYKLKRASVDEARPRALTLAGLLAKEAASLVLPAMQPTEPSEILAARHRLKDHLPPFWSAMLKLTGELRLRIASMSKVEDILSETRDLVDITVRPALIDLRYKLESERKQWAYRILAPVQRGLRLLIGSPLVTPPQMVAAALVVGADTAAGVADNLRAVEMMKRDSGLMFLLAAQDVFDSAG